jgi:hypothetical protein
MRKSIIALLITLLIVGIEFGNANAATVERARNARGPLWTLKVEGDIVPGDTEKLHTKLLDYYFIYGPAIRYVDLRSKGGDVDEAMKMGAMIRRLRLGTSTPNIFDGKDLDPDYVVDKENNVCASACFLVYAGGIEHQGYYLSLHRPYISKIDAERLSDIEHEASEKKAMDDVRKYLQDMEINQFFIDKMMSNNSQDSYTVTISDGLQYHLDAIVPSIEEIVLAKCSVLSTHEIRILETTNDKTPEGRAIREKLFAKHDAERECTDKALADIRKAAYEREIDDLYVRPKCNLLDKQELDFLTRTANGATPKESRIRESLIPKIISAKECRNKALEEPEKVAWRRQKSDISADLSTH